MALAFDQAGTAIVGASGTSLNYTGLTISAGLVNPAALFCATFATAPGTVTATWNGVSVPIIVDGTSDTFPTYLFGITNPASGNKTFALSWTTAAVCLVGGISLSGVDQTGGTTSFPSGNNQFIGSGTSLTENVITTAGQWAFGGFSLGTATGSPPAASSPAGTVEFSHDDTASSGLYIAGVLYSGGAAGTVTFTGKNGTADVLAIVGCAINPARDITFRQITSTSFGSGTSSTTCTFGTGIASGSIIAVATSWTSVPRVTISNDKGDAVTDSGLGIIFNAVPNSYSCIKAFLSPTAGAKIITLNFGSATSGGDVYIYEITGLPYSRGVLSPRFDQVVSANSSSNSTSTIVSSGATGTLSNALEAAIAFCVPAIIPPSSGANGAGWSIGQGLLSSGNNGDGVDQTNGGSGEHLITSSSSAVTGTFSIGLSGTAQVWVATFTSGPINSPCFALFRIG